MQEIAVLLKSFLVKKLVLTMSNIVICKVNAPLVNCYLFMVFLLALAYLNGE